MKKIMPLVLGSLLLLGTTACNEMTGTIAADGVRSEQIESDARARDQRSMNPGTNATDVSGIRKDQLESAARARAQRDGMDPATANNVTIAIPSPN